MGLSKWDTTRLRNLTEKNQAEQLNPSETKHLKRLQRLKAIGGPSKPNSVSPEDVTPERNGL